MLRKAVPLAQAATAGSSALIFGALGFQYIGELHPCLLCLWQRVPHVAAIVLGLIWLRSRGKHHSILWLLALVMVVSTGLGFYHAGVEQGWWQFNSSCTQGSIAGLSVTDLLNPDANVAAPVRCDAIAWSFLGLSMAAWNGVASAVLTALWVKAAFLGNVKTKG